MKNFLKNLLFISLLTIALIFGNTSCKEDTDCKLQVTVKLFNDTNTVVPNAIVNLRQGDTYLLGTTGALGIYERTFKLEAILQVAVLDTALIDSIAIPPRRIKRTGEGTVRLKEGETVKKTIFIK